MTHTAIRLLATQTNDPLGMAAKQVLDELAAHQRLVWWLLALVAVQNERRTRGGIPRPYTQRWTNRAQPIDPGRRL